MATHYARVKESVMSLEKGDHCYFEASEGETAERTSIHAHGAAKMLGFTVKTETFTLTNRRGDAVWQVVKIRHK